MIYVTKFINITQFKLWLSTQTYFSSVNLKISSHSMRILSRPIFFGVVFLPLFLLKSLGFHKELTFHLIFEEFGLVRGLHHGIDLGIAIL